MCSDAGPSAEEEAKTALSLAKDKGKTRAGPPQLQGPMKRPKSVLKSAYWSGEQNARNKVHSHLWLYKLPAEFNRTMSLNVLRFSFQAKSKVC